MDRLGYFLLLCFGLVLLSETGQSDSGVEQCVGHFTRPLKLEDLDPREVKQKCEDLRACAKASYTTEVGHGQILRNIVGCVQDLCAELNKDGQKRLPCDFVDGAARTIKKL
ncbi:uncharacterized protein LOC123297926 [Chrysoperla carnea]|uniref:uncharacterized protein LOC123297926 n=1 Tax=Chrysoperla carnea TaxID=189513 RepID=UPI001D08C3C3|nr:uncharacterized protein LOC123297926 [Chrysoperla carnea]